MSTATTTDDTAARLASAIRAACVSRHLRNTGTGEPVNLPVAIVLAGERIGSGLEAVAKAIDRLAEAVREGQL